MHLPELVQRTHASLVDAYLLAILLGIFGAHHLYLRRTVWGFLYLFTFGLFGVGWLIDLCRLPFLVSRFNKEASDHNLPKKKHLDDAYVLWFPGGLLGSFMIFHILCNSKKHNHKLKTLDLIRSQINFIGKLS